MPSSPALNRDSRSHLTEPVPINLERFEYVSPAVEPRFGQSFAVNVVAQSHGQLKLTRSSQAAR